MAMTPMGGGDGGFRPMSEINVTPFVDVMLVLLIVFMVAAPLLMVGVPVDLPKTQAAKLAQTRKPLVVTVDREGRLFMREEALPADDPAPRLAELAAADPEAVVYIRGDRSIPYGRIMEVMGMISTAGFARVSLIAEAAPRPAGS